MAADCIGKGAIGREFQRIAGVDAVEALLQLLQRAAPVDTEPPPVRSPWAGTAVPAGG